MASLVVWGFGPKGSYVEGRITPRPILGVRGLGLSSSAGEAQAGRNE